MSTIRVGTCGYRFYDPGEDWDDRYESVLQAYSDAFDVGELNRTFYRLPQVSTAERWRREAADDFAFAVKAWQALTHPWRSPTWNDYRDAVPDDRADEVGSLRPTAMVGEAWERTREVALALEAEVVVMQTPPSFDCTDEHESNLRSVLGSVEREGFRVAWEPRGEWADHPDRVREICADLELIHVVDAMRVDPLDDGEVAYTRLHGLNEDPYDYDYAYDDGELDELAATLRGYAADRECVYCLFNNYEMYDDAQALRTRLTE